MTTKRTKGGDAISDLLLTTFQLNGAFLEAADRISAPSDLTAARWQILGSVVRADMSVAEIARLMGLARQSVQRIANILEKEGMVAFKDNPAHQRAKLVVATPAGIAANATLAERQHIWANAMAAGIDESAIIDCVEMMRKITQRLNETH